MKRLLMISATLTVVVGAMLIALPFLVSSDSVRERILSSVMEITGRSATFTGDPGVSFSPFLGITIQNLTIGDPYSEDASQPLLFSEEVQAKLDLLPALFGSVEISEYRLLRPRLNLKTYADGRANWEFKSEDTEQTAEADSSGSGDGNSTNLGTFTIVDGLLNYEDEISGNSETMTGIEGLINWPSTGDAGSINGSAIWRGENVSLTAELENPLALSSSGESNIYIKFSSTPLNLTFNGSANMLPDLFVNGELEASTPSVSRLSNLTGFELSEFSKFGAVEVNGMLSGTSGDFRLSEAEISLSEQAANGVLRLSSDEVGVPRIDGTLAFDTFDITSYFTIPDQSDNANSSPKPSSGVRADLRVSANVMMFRDIKLERVAASIYAGDGNWVFDIGDSLAFGGQFIGKVGERFENEMHQFFFQLSGRDVDSGAASAIFENSPVTLSGLCDIDLDLKLNQPAAEESERQIDGSIAVNMVEGNINGIDLLGLLGTDLAGASPATLDFADGNTPVNDLEFTMSLNGGIASVTKAAFKSGETSIRLFGNADFKTGNLALRAQEVTAAGVQPERLFIGGTFSSPLVALKPGELKSPKTKPEEPEDQVSN